LLSSQAVVAMSIINNEKISFFIIPVIL